MNLNLKLGLKTCQNEMVPWVLHSSHEEMGWYKVQDTNSYRNRMSQPSWLKPVGSGRYEHCLDWYRVHCDRVTLFEKGKKKKRACGATLSFPLLWSQICYGWRLRRSERERKDEGMGGRYGLSMTCSNLTQIHNDMTTLHDLD